MHAKIFWQGSENWEDGRGRKFGCMYAYVERGERKRGKKCHHASNWRNRAINFSSVEKLISVENDPHTFAQERK